MTIAVITCPKCEGEGTIPDPSPVAEGFLEVICPVCDGECWLEGETDVVHDRR